jgi:hypothetical protein
MAGGFLNRWSRLKSGEQVEPEKKSVAQAKEELTTPSELNRSLLMLKSLRLRLH